MPMFDVVLRHVNNPDNVVRHENIEAIDAESASRQARLCYMLPGNWVVVEVRQK